MCGICGDVNFNNAPASVEAVSIMNEALIPRGPDSGDIYEKGRVVFGHRRLKIIDLSDQSKQPMTDDELGLSIVFNGCIYNYKELREELIEKGYRFFSSGDTEVIVKAFHAWGLECVQRFHGMFAFVIHEHASGRIIMARDRFGIKPLYYIDRPNGIRFASSLPALLAAGEVDKMIDPVALHHYMHWHAVVPAPHTIIKGVRKLPPATIRTIDADGTLSERTYWKLNINQSDDDRKITGEEWQERVLDALRLAVKRRMVADVPVGVLLSGGVDSSLIVGLLAEAGQKDLNTFSVGFEEAGGEKGDEFQYSDLIANHYGTTHHKKFVPSSDLLEALPKTIRAMSEPMVSYDNVGFFLLSQEVSQHLKVVQSGQGADEIFAGYHWYPPMMETGNAIDKYQKAFFDQDEATYVSAVTGTYHESNYSREFVEAHFSKPGADRDVDKALRLDSTVMLVDDPVKRVDNMTMAWGLEARVPFLDHELCELAGRIPAEYKVKNSGKWVLKEAARKVIPSEVIDRPKGYFPVPALKYIQGPYLEMVKDALLSDTARQRGIFKESYIQTLLTDPKDHITPLRGSKLWQVALLELWLQEQGI
ncbi:N-acetylglutaminylglutamine amidotransferase [Terasakiella sp. A23]|uniref:N-acetylglutaminylglutamine amidotransferase n=1 Tax=Terasakiella sp. FCG-A23 TaxID=3080561 RepID=UPI002952FE11|nr:N-acetylglutaminylglutamine amidotransferase [Terasakiella sp. A23]MDV7340928.1 N-acetylglutaminylglutamine amidotransferase [Terasakiella sp. A23]